MLDQSNHQVFKLLFMEYHTPCYIVRWCEVKGRTGRFEMLALLFWQTDNPDAMAEGCGVIIHWITLFPSCLISLRTVLDGKTIVWQLRRDGIGHNGAMSREIPCGFRFLLGTFLLFIFLDSQRVGLAGGGMVMESVVIAEGRSASQGKAKRRILQL